MKRYCVDKNSDGEIETDMKLSRFDPPQDFYLASDVDVHMAQLVQALRSIAEHRGMTLLGPTVEYSEGAHAAFGQMAEIARDAIEAETADGDLARSNAGGMRIQELEQLLREAYLAIDGTAWPELETRIGKAIGL